MAAHLFRFCHACCVCLVAQPHRTFVALFSRAVRRTWMFCIAFAAGMRYFHPAFYKFVPLSLGEGWGEGLPARAQSIFAPAERWEPPQRLKNTFQNPSLSYSHPTKATNLSPSPWERAGVRVDPQGLNQFSRLLNGGNRRKD